MENKFTCCICNNEACGIPNKAEPFLIGEDKKCCDECNRKYVFPWRMYISNSSADEKWRKEKEAFFEALPIPEKCRSATMILVALEKKNGYC